MSKAAELAALIGSQTALSNRNLIINGGMKVNQRGTNSSITSGSANFGPDRFRMQISDLGTWEMSQSTTTPSGQGFSHSLKLNCTTADTSVAAGSYLLLQQVIEGQNLQQACWGTSSAKPLTYSFWIRATKTGTITVEFQHQNSSGNYFTRSTTFTVSSSNTWEKKIISVPANTSQDIENLNTDGFYITWWFSAGSNWTGGTFNNSAYVTGSGIANTRVSSDVVNHADSTSNEIYITGVQLEVGSTATDFDHSESYGETLAKCQRYYTRWQSTAAKNWPRFFQPAYVNNGYVSGTFAFPTQMRDHPSLAFTGTWTYQNSDGAGTGAINQNGVNIYVQSTGAEAICGYSAEGGSLDMDAEL